MEGGVFSSWAAGQLRPTSFCHAPGRSFHCLASARAAPRRLCRGFSITPILSIMASALEEQPDKFTLVYGNRSMASVMFNEALQDLRILHPDRLT